MDKNNTNNQTLTPKIPQPAPHCRLLDEKDQAKVQASISIHKIQPQAVFDFWRNFSNLSLFMKDIESIEVLNHETSKWNVKLKSGISASWTASVIAEKPGSFIAWKSIEGDVETEGAISFTPPEGRPGTTVTLAMNYKIPGGKLGEIATALVGENPEMLISTNLKRLRCLLETGEIATTEGQTSGRSSDQNNQKNIH